MSTFTISGRFRLEAGGDALDLADATWSYETGAGPVLVDQWTGCPRFEYDKRGTALAVNRNGTGLPDVIVGTADGGRRNDLRCPGDGYQLPGYLVRSADPRLGPWIGNDSNEAVSWTNHRVAVDVDATSATGCLTLDEEPGQSHVLVGGGARYVMVTTSIETTEECAWPPPPESVHTFGTAWLIVLAFAIAGFAMGRATR